MRSKTAPNLIYLIYRAPKKRVRSPSTDHRPRTSALRCLVGWFFAPSLFSSRVLNNEDAKFGKTGIGGNQRSSAPQFSWTAAVSKISGSVFPYPTPPFLCIRACVTDAAGTASTAAARECHAKHRCGTS